MPAASRTIEIAVPEAELFAIVQDFQRYPEFIPEMKRVRVIRRGPAGEDVEFELELELPLGLRKRIRYTLTFTEEPPRTVRWKLVSGDFLKGNVGSWTFRPLSERRTEATYAIDLSFGALVPKVVTHFLAEQSLPRLLGQFKARAEAMPRKPVASGAGDS